MNKRTAITAELPRLRRYARALLRDPGGADDLVQDCLERALSRLHQFQAGTNMRAWLFTIMHGIHVNAVRKGIRAANAGALDPHTLDCHSTPPAQAHGLAVRELAAALDQISDEQRQVLLLVALEGMTYGEAAEILDVPVGTIMSRLARGRARLRGMMNGEDSFVRGGIK